ncbi:unnamed protein product [Fraxinus pennsylvanica]|uniref:Uncharacterized protein n=1 Tax=Fraxinus pennsylvanica TaxID=56036 RepID=A0AAD2E0K1_9LAMI|nr:unnamed protein product [Fraxinus pennsylvanica]
MASPSGSPQQGGWFMFRYEEDRESPTDARNVLLMWRRYSGSDFSGQSQPSWWHLAGHPRWTNAGACNICRPKTSILCFLDSQCSGSFNSHILISLTYGFPFYFEVCVDFYFVYVCNLCIGHFSPLHLMNPSDFNIFCVLLLCLLSFSS